MLRRFQIPIAALLMLGLSATSLHAGKPGSNPPPPPPPLPVKYQVQFWTVSGASSVSDVYDTNNQSQTVGSCIVNNDGSVPHAFLYDPNVDPEFAVDLNTIVSNIPIGWSIRKATAINNVGEIVAYIEPIGAPLSELQPILIDMNQFPPVMYLVPDREFTTYSLPGDINDWGDIVVRYQRADGSTGHYVFNFDPLSGLSTPQDLGIVTSSGNHPQINNFREVVGQRKDIDGYRLTLNGSREDFTGYAPLAINENGDFSGTARVSTGKRNSFTNCAFVYGNLPEIFTDIPSAVDLNESRDFVWPSYLHHSNYGKLTIKDLLDVNHPDSSLLITSTYLGCHTITDRVLGTDFPVLTGSAIISGSVRGIQLFPVAP